jgi:hypothetical protein
VLGKILKSRLFSNLLFFIFLCNLAYTQFSFSALFFYEARIKIIRSNAVSTVSFPWKYSTVKFNFVFLGLSKQLESRSQSVFLPWPTRSNLNLNYLLFMYLSIYFL